MKFWITLALLLQSAVSYGTDTCVVAENIKARKMLACGFSKTDKLVVDMSSSDFVAKKFESASVSYPSGRKEIYDFTSYKQTIRDPETYVLRLTKRGSPEWLEIYINDHAYNETNVSRLNNGDVGPMGGLCQYATTGSTDSCFPDSKRVRPYYPETLDFGNCRLEKGYSSPTWLSYFAYSECELAPGYFIRYGTADFEPNHPLNYPLLTHPLRINASRPFEHRSGIWGIGLTNLDINMKATSYTLAKDAYLGCGLFAYAGGQVIWKHTEAQIPVRIDPDLRNGKFVLVNGVPIPESDKNEITFKEKSSGSGEWYPAICVLSNCRFIPVSAPIKCNGRLD